jgi:hypothetical protein
MLQRKVMGSRGIAGIDWSFLTTSFYILSSSIAKKNYSTERFS